MGIYSPYEEELWNYFVSEIGNEYGVAALMGNLKAESILTPGRIQNDLSSGMVPSDAYTEMLLNDQISETDFVGELNSNTKLFYYNGVRYGPAYGLAQWDYYSRRQDYWDLWHAGGHGVAGSLEFEEWFVVWELRNNYTYVLSVLQNATNIRQASDVVLIYYESPYDQSEAVKQGRAAIGQRLYDEYAGTTPVPPSPPDPPDPPPDPPDPPDPPIPPTPIYPEVKKLPIILYSRQPL